VDAASIVVLTTQHQAVAKEFLKRSIPVLVEKPLAATAEQAADLAETARRHGTLLQVGHIERFNPAFESLLSRPLQPKFVTCERLGPFTGRAADVGVVLDLMIHDLDLLLTLVGQPVTRVEALGVSVFGRHEDLAQARLHFNGGCLANVTASRVHPTPKRLMTVWGPEGFAAVDFGQRRLTLTQPSESLRKNGLDPANLDAASRGRIREELFGRWLETLTLDGHAQDQLTAELAHFVQCARARTEPRVTGEHGRDALFLAERILQAIREHAWDGGERKGPLNLPTPYGSLFTATGQREAA
jgi:predicted dehydrogenase